MPSDKNKKNKILDNSFYENLRINKSLKCFSVVICALFDRINGHKQVYHIPYRDSKITFFLKNALSDNSKTSMIYTISPTI
jgi:hypothetical protein